LLQVHTGKDFNIFGEFYMERGEGVARPRGIMGQAVTSGMFFSSCLIIVLGWTIIQIKAHLKIFGLATLMSGAIALIQSLTRGAWLSFMISGFIFLIVGNKKNWLQGKIIFFSIISTIVVVIFFWSNIYSRITGDDGGSAYSRLPSMILMTRIIIDNLVLGIGTNNYIDKRTEYFSLDLEGALRQPHNQYLLVWVETGTIGFFAFCWFLITVFKEGITLLKAQEPYRSILGGTFNMSLFSICLSTITDAALSGPVAILTWLLAGLICGSSKCLNKKYLTI
jgi:O-antigen ligase